MRCLKLFGVLFFSVFAVFSQTPVRQTNVTGDVFRYADFPSKITDARNVDVWLPPDYAAETDKKYPVIYMHDGQNLFDPRQSFSKIDWGIDETMTRLIRDNKIKAAIVVGIWNTPRRTIEFMPQRAFDVRDNIKRKSEKIDVRSAESDKYLKFLTAELKPFIDKTYRTKTDRKNTFVMGSSMGGLMSLYAIGEYPDIFGGAGCLSTHYPLGDGVMLHYMKEYLPSPKKHKIYFDFGTRGLDARYEPYQMKADALMRKKGYRQDKNWITRKFVGDDHSEKYWRARVAVPLIFFLAK